MLVDVVEVAKSKSGNKKNALGNKFSYLLMTRGIGNHSRRGKAHASGNVGGYAKNENWWKQRATSWACGEPLPPGVGGRDLVGLHDEGKRCRKRQQLRRKIQLYGASSRRGEELQKFLTWLSEDEWNRRWSSRRAQAERDARERQERLEREEAERLAAHGMDLSGDDLEAYLDEIEESTEAVQLRTADGELLERAEGGAAAE